MIDLALYLAFLPAVLALNLTPGPDMLFTMAQGLRGGKRPAIAAAGGIATGAFLNAALAGLGLGALVAAAPWVFGVVRWAGVAYLIYLAIQTLRTPLSGQNTQPIRPARAFRDGLVVNMSNPSVILFILAFIPQFVDPTLPILPQFLIYGATIAGLGFCVKAAVGLSAGSFARALTRSPATRRTLRYVTAGIFGALALRVAWSGVKP
ncbi:MAG: LysE family translocator [Pseudomonadota bacterium]